MNLTDLNWSSQQLPVVRTPIALKRQRTKSLESDFEGRAKVCKKTHDVADLSSTTTNEKNETFCAKQPRLNLYTLQTEMRSMFSSMEKKMADNFTKLTAEMKTTVKEVVAETIQTEISKIEDQLHSFGERIGHLENLEQNMHGLSEGLTRDIADITGEVNVLKGDVTESEKRIRKAEEDIDELVRRNKDVEAKAALAMKAAGETKGKDTRENDDNKCCIFIRGLRESPKEKADPNVTTNLVYNVIREGMHQKDVKLRSAVRKESRGSAPGVIVAHVVSEEQKKHLLKSKKRLASSEKYKRVYVEEFKPLDERKAEANTRMLLQAMGKEDLKLSRKGFIVKNKKKY